MIKYTPEMARAIRKLPRPVEVSVDIISFKEYFAVTPREPTSKYTIEERILINRYLFEIQQVFETFGAVCRVFGFDGIKG